MTPKVVVSVVSGARAEHIVNLLASLRPSVADPSLDATIVVTLNTRDDALAQLVRSGGPRCDVIVNDEPRGYATNHNHVIATYPADHYVIANDDVIVPDGAMRALVAFMDQPANARVGVASPVLRNPDGTLQPSTSAFPTIPRTLLSMSGLRRTRVVDAALRSVGKLPIFGGGRTKYWAHDRTMSVATLNGAFVIVRGATIADVGLMDEVSLAGGEEAEWHKRMADHGWAVVLLHGVEVTHIGEQTVGGWSRRDLEYAKGWFNYFAKHSTTLRTRVLAAGAWLVWGARAAISSARGDAEQKELARDAMRLSRRVWSDGDVRTADRAPERA